MGNFPYAFIHFVLYNIYINYIYIYKWTIYVRISYENHETRGPDERHRLYTKKNGNELKNHWGVELE